MRKNADAAATTRSHATAIEAPTPAAGPWTRDDDRACAGDRTDDVRGGGDGGRIHEPGQIRAGAEGATFALEDDDGGSVGVDGADRLGESREVFGREGIQPRWPTQPHHRTVTDALARHDIHPGPLSISTAYQSNAW